MKYIEITADYKIFYHGTTVARLESILKHGLKKVKGFCRRHDESSKVKSLNNAYFTDRLVDALDYAYFMSDNLNDKTLPLIVLIRVDTDDNQLLADEDNMSKLDEFLVRNYFILIKSIKEITKEDCIKYTTSYLKDNELYNRDILNKYKSVVYQYIKYKYSLYEGLITNPKHGRKFIRVMMNMFTELMRANNKIFNSLCKSEITFTGNTRIVAIYKILKDNSFERVYGSKGYDKYLSRRILSMLINKNKPKFLYPPHFVHNDLESIPLPKG